jgi:alpha-galactosidase
MFSVHSNDSGTSSRLPRRLLSAVASFATVLGGVVATQVVLPAAPAYALDNGLARTPPMGFNDWNAFGCNVSEQLIKQTADLFVSSGLKAAGYEYVNIDDCWMTHSRDPQTGRLVPDPVKFPDGIKGTADYVHSLGLKLGIYEDSGTSTCAGYPGSLGHETVDAQTFADWGVDYLKYDNCNNSDTTQAQYIARYTAMSNALTATGRPIVFSLCEWGQLTPWTWAPGIGNLWRTTGDISDNWNSLKSIVNANLSLAPYSKPGAFNDPDMLEVGNGGMTDAEYRSHFALWSMMDAPLLIGTDLRRASAETLAILTNKDLIAVDQDPLGVQATPIANANGLITFAKPLANGDVAVALFNESDSAARIATTASAAGLPNSRSYLLNDLEQHTTTESAGTISAFVPAHATVVYRISAQKRNTGTVAPATALSIGLPGAQQFAGQQVVSSGHQTAVSTTLENNGSVTARDAAVTLTAPTGWSTSVQSSPTASELRTGKSLTTQWTITPPVGTAPGTYTLTAATIYYWGGTNWVTASSPISFLVAVPPPSGTSNLSDLTWLSASNTWGPVEKDMSNGEASAGDGHTITIAGVQYAKGFGTNAPAEIDFYLGGACSTVRTDVGLDDEEAGHTPVADFQIWADGSKVADSGPTTEGAAALHLTANVAGAQLLRLVVDDQGSPSYNHTDWAAPTITCGS